MLELAVIRRKVDVSPARLNIISHLIISVKWDRTRQRLDNTFCIFVVLSDVIVRLLPVIGSQKYCAMEYVVARLKHFKINLITFRIERQVS